MKKNSNQVLREAILHNIYTNGQVQAAELAAQHTMTTQNIYKHVKRLESEGIIEPAPTDADKKTKHYRLTVLDHLEKTYTREGLNEDVVLRADFSKCLAGVSASCRNIFSYVFTEMVNNAIDHSESIDITIELFCTAYSIGATVRDGGVGIFRKIADAMKLPELRFAILELAKGKFTTEPDSHTGEGIFFASKMADSFAIDSDGLRFSDTREGDTILTNVQTNQTPGTLVYFEISRNSDRNIEDTFNQYTEYPDGYSFSKTTVPVRVLEYMEENPIFVSRSQAKRLLVRFDRFQSIPLDFSGVDSIGQGFADEIFLVFAKQHPQSVIQAINASPQVQRMIAHVQSNL